MRRVYYNKEKQMTDFLTFLLVIVTSFYAWVTYKILKANENVVKEMEKQYKGFIRPYISVGIKTFTGNSCLFLRIKNIGKSGAENLRITLDRNFYKLGHKDEKNNLKSLPAFSNPIQMFAPDAELLFRLAQGFVVFGENANSEITPRQFNINLSYTYMNSFFEERIAIDLTPYVNTTLPQSPIVKALDRINDSISKK